MDPTPVAPATHPGSPGVTPPITPTGKAGAVRSAEEESTGPLENLSPSRASDFKTCPRLYRFRHIEKLPSVPTPAQARGTAIHLALERLFDTPAPERHPDRLLDLLETAWEETLEYDEYQDLFAEDPDRREQYYQASRKVAERYFQVEDPREIEPLEREKLITLLIDAGRRHHEGQKLEVRGIIDRLDPGPDGDLVITDYKTGKAPPLRFSDSSFFALKIYALMVQQNSGRTPSLVRLVYLGNSVAYSQPVSDRQLRAIKQQLQALWQAIDRAIATDTFPTRKTRLCGWCSYQPICPAWVDETSTGTDAGPDHPPSSLPSP